ncbi:MAG: 4-aminobutyrate--2-oxoglutarate transaminase [Xanthomonadales bacterium]|nr:4-aminobutyrate--2-oxoglutarate transaminase [Xanthomonadales bacterium]
MPPVDPEAQSPSPKEHANAAWHQRRIDAVPRGVATLLEVYAERAQNAELWDVEGNRYIDFASGIAVLNTGHLHPRVKAAVNAQLHHFSHVCFQVTPYPAYIELAERLNELAPGPSKKKTIFLSTGAEAVENAVKIARAHTGRSGVIAFSGGFHGRTMMAMALTGKVVPYKAGFGPMSGQVYHLPFPIAYHGKGVEKATQALEDLFSADLDPDQIAAIIIEPVQGEGGFYVAPPEFLQALRELCDEHGIVMIADEVQSGFARTGKLFAMDHWGIEPDLMTTAKSLAGGFPLSAVTGKAEIMDAARPGGLGGTYAGSPVSCAAALAVLDVIEDECLCSRAEWLGALMRELLEQIQADPQTRNAIGEIRGLGAMVAMELVEDGDASRPAATLTKALVQACASKGLIILACGVRGNVIRFLAPLTISESEVREGLGILHQALVELLNPADA